jgi:hypothetical protein
MGTTARGDISYDRLYTSTGDTSCNSYKSLFLQHIGVTFTTTIKSTYFVKGDVATNTNYK